MSTQSAWGLGLATIVEDQVLDTWFAAGRFGLGEAPAGSVDPIGMAEPGALLVTIGSLADPPKDAHDVYLRLHLLSARLITPHEANLTGIFGLLTNVAWTSAGPCLPEQVSALQQAERAAGRRITVYGVDKFPRMIDYVVPSGVRIADADRVRLGAHLAAATTVMN
jgi:2,3,4,5-tetrahydropyridine-2-carboxylate N-succinyltransferase